ncbi:hypothetical protein B0H14DRAFT_2622346 [Mycena olivaceomarginata]|nr:hypothetical protein B0H14DRAFT_2622346 [Mycena olivaceomarginata]
MNSGGGANNRARRAGKLGQNSIHFLRQSTATTSLLAAISMFIAGARAQCPNSGVGVGEIQLCNFNSKNIVCGELMGFITKPGGWNEAAIKNDLNVLPGDLCGDYTGSPEFEPMHTICSGNTITEVVPPNAGAHSCQSENIVTGVLIELLFHGITIFHFSNLIF